MTDDVHATRRGQARTRLAAVDADGLVCFPSRNLQYLTGFEEEPGERHFLLVLPAGERDDGAADDAETTADDVTVPATLLVPELYGEQVRTETDVGDVRTWVDGDDPREAVREVLDDHDVRSGRLLVDDTMWARFTQDLRAVAPAATWGLASEALADLRVRKDESEVAALRAAAAAADATVSDLRALGSEAIGTTERELADWIADRLTTHGGEDVSFETIVAAGENGAKPHHSPSDRMIRAGDPVVLDFGTRVDGYPSDQTRTLVFDDEPPDEYERVHAVVREAQSAAVEAVEPGVTAAAIDRTAREIIEEAGYGDAFVHRTGHGVGLDVHEEPYVVAGNDRELEPGMVFSVEPGVYLEGRFGCRIEDLVVVTAEGAERLNTTDHDWH